MHFAARVQRYMLFCEFIFAFLYAGSSFQNAIEQLVSCIHICTLRSLSNPTNKNVTELRLEIQTALSRGLFRIRHMFIWTPVLTVAVTVTSPNIDLTCWITLYIGLQVHDCIEVDKIRTFYTKYLSAWSTHAVFTKMPHTLFHHTLNCLNLIIFSLIFKCSTGRNSLTSLLIWPFKDEVYLFYIRTQCVPRCKHSPLRL
jgi:uncharacterized protein involved in response to NO